MYLERTEELPQNKNYLFGCYPHGVLCSGLFGNFATKSPEFDKLFPGLKTTVHTLDGNFSHPLVRDLILSLGKDYYFTGLNFYINLLQSLFCRSCLFLSRSNFVQS